VTSEDHGLPFEETLDKIKELEAQWVSIFWIQT
jgi:hypothetical protein